MVRDHGFHPRGVAYRILRPDQVDASRKGDGSIAKMVEADRYCMDILAQTAAIRSAVLGVEKLVLENHAQHCVEAAIASGDPEEQRAKFEELIGLLQKASK
jgi:DNA-binding FrmR family transcriptional regulator